MQASQALAYRAAELETAHRSLAQVCSLHLPDISFSNPCLG
jgi:hypothetical protein